MIQSTDTSTQASIISRAASLRESERPPVPFWRKLLSLHRMMWIAIAMACLVTTWFAYQLFLVPQPASFTPDWGTARWVQAADAVAPVAYFRYMTALSALPDNGFVTVAANQVFRLYVNGTYVGSNSLDFVQGDFPRAYMYDVSALLQPGPNILALRVANLDEHIPSVRASLGVVLGQMLYRYGTGDGWVATARSSAAHLRYAASLTAWTSSGFDASSWLPVGAVTTAPVSPMLSVNPLIYEQPVPSHWLSAGYGPDAYFVRQFSQSYGTTHIWLRLAATGTANVYINGHLLIVWTGQPPVPQQNLANYLSDDETPGQYRSGLELGIYDISPYLHPGQNTIAIHVLAPGISAAHVGLDTLSSAMSLDMLFHDVWGHDSWLTSADGWHVSTHPAGGWMAGENVALSWPSPVIIGRPGAVSAFYLPEHMTPRNIQFVPPSLFLQVVLCGSGAVIGSWLLSSLWLLRRYYHAKRQALEAASLAYLPAVAFGLLLVALSREPQIPRPFPYTWFWFLLLIALVCSAYLVLWINVRPIDKRRSPTVALEAPRVGLLRRYQETAQKRSKRQRTLISSLLLWLRANWLLVFLVLLAVPLSCYNLAYEPYWQDELASYYASRGVLAHGLPFFPSGFLYPKAELYSYLLALWTTVFSEQCGVTRAISALEYLVSLPLLYVAGCYFFERHVAMLATAMLAISPISLVWSRQMRMYEQAQLLTLLAVFLFYKAIQERERVYLVYIAALCLVLAYLSHEETFIILPGIVLSVLLASRNSTRRLPAVLYQKHWWFAAVLCVTVIGLQLSIAHLSHPPSLGTDATQRPLVTFTTDNIVYYLYLLFAPDALGHGTLPWIALNSLLAAVGCLWARYSADKRAKYCALFLVASMLTLVLLFTFQADRYIYTFLPIYYLMGAYAFVALLRAVWIFARSRLMSRQSGSSPLPFTVDHLSTPVRMLVACTVSLVCASVLLVSLLPVSGYNLFVSRLVGFAYHRHYADYDAVGQYMRQHWRKRDVVIAVAPANCVLYYAGHVDYFFSIDRAMYLIEHEGRLIETASGAQALLNQGDFQAVLSAYGRVWIVSDSGSYQSQVMKRFVFPPDFHLVFEGYGSSVYFRGDDP